ncbi:MAG: hypothetical protein RL693_1621 [Verrucomicrobiota bacterium]|jgi:3-methyladenine DNA glycosylase AlkD
MSVAAVLNRLRALGSADNVAGMGRYGIPAGNALGVSVPNLRSLAKELGRNHSLALQLWDTRVHEARVLTAFIGSPKELTKAEMERIVLEINSWDICDQLCGEFFNKHPLAYQKAVAWSKREEEFVKRAGFVLMARLAVHDKKADDATFFAFLPLIKKESIDERNMVKKAVNWALRQIGKRNLILHEAALLSGERIAQLDNKAARWIAADALRELRNKKTVARIKSKKTPS